MSQKNVEVVNRIAEAFGQGGVEAVLEFFGSDIEWHEDPSFPEAGVYRGRDAVETYAREFLSSFAEVRYQPEDLLDEGDHVIADMRISGRGKASGAEFDIRASWAMTFREGKVVRCHAFLDRARALEAVGLPK